MSGTNLKKDELVLKVRAGLKEYSKWSIILHQSIADSLNLNITDNKCLDFIYEMGSVTAGQLAEFAGLTTGAITALVDRLEKNGFVKRDKDVSDRRKVVIKPIKSRNTGNVPVLFDSMNKDYEEFLSKYTEQELTFILDFILKSNSVTHEKAKQIQRDNENK